MLRHFSCQQNNINKEQAQHRQRLPKQKKEKDKQLNATRITRIKKKKKRKGQTAQIKIKKTRQIELGGGVPAKRTQGSEFNLQHTEGREEEKKDCRNNQ